MLYSTNKVPSHLKGLNLDSLICFAAGYLDLDEDLELEIVFSNLGEGKCGHVEYDEELYEVYLNKCLSEEEFIRTLFHEMVHVKQIFNGEYDPDTSMWNGVVYKVDYSELPWEKEAYVLEEKIFNAY